MSTSSTGVGLEDALPRAYDDLCRLARRYQSRQPTAARLAAGAAVHETVLRLLHQRCRQWQDLPHFVGTAATLLRRVILDHRRSLYAARRGGPEAIARSTSLEEGSAVVSAQREEDVALHQALARLERRSPRQARVVRLRFLAGMTVEETAAALRIAPATVRRDWAAARRWLRRELAA